MCAPQVAHEVTLGLSRGTIEPKIRMKVLWVGDKAFDVVDEEHPGDSLV